MRHHLLVTVLFLAAACGSDGPAHWKDQPLESMSGTIEGKSFTIELPKGMQKSKVESKYSVDFDYHVGDRVYAPSVSVGHTDKKSTLADELAREKTKEVAFKEESAEGWAYGIENDAYKGREDYLIRAQRFVGEGALTCNGRVHPLKKGESTKEHIPLVAKMCASLKVK